MSSPTSPPSSVTSSHIPSGPHGLRTLRITIICKHFTNNKTLKCYTKECCSLKPAWLPATKGILWRTFHLRKAPQNSPPLDDSSSWHTNLASQQWKTTDLLWSFPLPSSSSNSPFSVRSQAKSLPDLWCQLIISECLVLLGTYYSQVLWGVPRWVRSCDKVSFQHKSKLCAINNQPRRAS